MIAAIMRALPAISKVTPITTPLPFALSAAYAFTNALKEVRSLRIAIRKAKVKQRIMRTAQSSSSQ